MFLTTHMKKNLIDTIFILKYEQQIRHASIRLLNDDIH